MSTAWITKLNVLFWEKKFYHGISVFDAGFIDNGQNVCHRYVIMRNVSLNLVKHTTH